MACDYDTYVALIRKAEETPEEERTQEQKDLLAALENSPSWDDLFRRNKDKGKQK